MNLTGENEAIFEFERFRLVPCEGLLLENANPISLDPKTFAVLALLVERHGHVLSKSDIIQSVWDGAFIEEGVVAKAIWRLRNALGDTSKEKFIQTVPKRGYRFVAPVRTAGEPWAIAAIRKTPSIRLRHVMGGGLVLAAVTLATYLYVTDEPLSLADDTAPVKTTDYRAVADAEDAYLKGKYYFDTATNSAKTNDKIVLFDKAIGEFEKAVAFDPRFADAYAWLARTYHWLGSNSDKPEAYVKSKVAAKAAIELDPSNAVAHASLAWVYWRLDWDWTRAEAEYQQVLGLIGDATGPLGHGYALFISAKGRHDEAVDIMRRYEESSPLSMSGKVSSAFIKLRARRYDAAEVDFRRILEFDPEQDTALSGLALTLSCQGRYDEAIVVGERARGNYENPTQRLTLAWVYARAGREKDALDLLARAEQQFRTDRSTNDAIAIAKVHAGLGNTEKAIGWLEKAFAVRSQYLVFLAVSPEFDTLHADDRFAGMLRRLGLSAR